MNSIAPASPGTGRLRLPLWLKVIYAFLIVLFLAAGVAAGTLVGYQYNLPPIQNLEDFHPDVITALYSMDNKVIGEFAVERRIVVSYEDIPAYLQLAILAAEDDQFYNHSGVNYLSILRAAYRDVLSMSAAEGASTISQQLSRILLGSYEKTPDRKIKELLITWKIERRYSKQQIFTLYCNQHYMGHGAYGVAAAADVYFGKQLKDLNLAECAMIAGLPRNPRTYSPRLHPQSALGRRNYILDRMVTEKMISPQAAEEAKARPMILTTRSRETEIAPYFVEWVRQALADRYTTEDIWRRGMRVYTTLDIAMQKAANQALQEGLRSYDKRHGWRGPVDNILKSTNSSLESYAHPAWRLTPHPGDIVVGLVESAGENEITVRFGRYRARVGADGIAWTRARGPSQLLKAGDLAHFQIETMDEANHTASLHLEQLPAAQGALIALDNATGELRAMVGGYDFNTSEFNRATQAMRQTGSTFKPFVYTTALEKGMTPDSTVVDSPISFHDGAGRAWQPGNYDGKFKGAMPLRQALAESRNVPTVKIASLIGIKNVLITARRFGLGGPMDPYLPLALGACEATPLEMAAAFTVFPNLGVQPRPYFIRRIEDYDHKQKEVYSKQTRQVLDPQIAETMLALLQNVVQSGTATAAKSLGRPVGGKTGTTNDFTDAWFVGFTPSLTAAVWIGNDTKVTLGEKESGAVAALPIWINFMQQVYRDRPIEEFGKSETPPEQITESSETPARKKLYVEEIPRNNRPPQP